MFLYLSLALSADREDLNCTICIVTSFYIRNAFKGNSLTNEAIRDNTTIFCETLGEKMENSVCLEIANTRVQDIITSDVKIKDMCSSFGYCMPSKTKEFVHILEDTIDWIVKVLYNRTVITERAELLINNTLKKFDFIGKKCKTVLQPVHDKVRKMLERAMEEEIL